MTAPAEHGDTPDLTEQERKRLDRSVQAAGWVPEPEQMDRLARIVAWILADRLSARSAATPDTAVQAVVIAARREAQRRKINGGPNVGTDVLYWFADLLQDALDPGTRDQADQDTRPAGGGT